MKTLLKWLGALAVIGGAAVLAMQPVAAYFKERSRPKYRTVDVQRRTISEVRNATGEVKPVLSVSIGSFVSGPINKLHVDFNDRVRKDQLLAEIDPRIYVAAVERDRATLSTRKADVERVRAQLQQAINDERRAAALREESEDFISQTEIDRFHFSRLAFAAQLDVARASVEQAKAQLANSEANLAYTKILSPVDGIVIDRKIDPGQTLAAQFQTPELFVIAPDMEAEMHIYASVDEADIGEIRDAQEEGRTVEFTVTAYPDDLFTGVIKEVRFSSSETQNVVTYPVVISTENPDLKLLPGMTADLSFEIAKQTDVLCVPNAALRFYPKKQQVREEDRKLLDADDSVEDDAEAVELSARQKVDAGEKRRRKHVWIQEDDKLRAIEIVVGLSDNRYTEVVSGDLAEDQSLVTGEKSD